MTTENRLAGAASVVGWGESYATDDEPRTPLMLATAAAEAALERAGIDKAEVEGVLTGYPPMADRRPRYNNILSSHMNVTPRFSTAITLHSAGVMSMFEYAALAVANDVADPVLCVQSDAASLYRNTDEHMSGADVDPLFEHPYGLVYPSVMALIARRQMVESGITGEQMAEVAVAAREWGQHHPHATMGDRGPLTVDDVLASPMVADPLHRYDCVPWGPAGTGGAFVVTRADRAASYDGTPIDVLGVGECSTHEYLSARPSVREAPVSFPSRITNTGAEASSRTAYEMAGLEPSDVDVAEVTYMFSNVALALLEDLGFCERGAAGEFVQEGGLLPGNPDLAFNTHGGDLTFGQPGVSMWMNTCIECIRQLSGETLGAAVPDARIGLVHGIGGTCSCHSTVLLGRGDGA